MTVAGPARPRDRPGLRRGARRPAAPAAVQLIVDGTDATSANVALGYACALVRELGAEVQERAAARAAGGALPRVGQAVLVPRVFYNPDLKSRWFYVPAVLAMILMVMTMLLSAMGVVREKEIGTHGAAHRHADPAVAAARRASSLPFAVIGLFQMCLATAVTVFGFGVPAARLVPAARSA